MQLKPGTRVHICAYVGPTFEPDWSEKGTIRKPRAANLPMPGPDWYIVEFDGCGALCVHRNHLMIANDQSKYQRAA